ncbi:MAG: flagellar brake protein [Methylobacter sp.]|nr:flagellar brake protein [Methylobacter sp.]MDP2097368.1 flagellar brake protein [Methylobacter sp.]MDP2428564.1 flagellar brake protein [Methylobacter sp.]MDP3056400.1 flagellar brake protein [Methylobacter sp.]MDP3363146.1 flagellar brake protein [Methylobacter sp.]
MARLKDINLQVGTRLQLTLPHGAVYYTEFIGYVDGEYLIIKTPFENGLSVQMTVDQSVTLRILSRVDVVTLNCTIKTIFRSPYYYMHLSFPKDVKVMTFRDAARAKVNLPVNVNGVAGAGVITNISVTGAGIIADKVLGELNEEASLSFDFPIKPTNQNAHVDTSATIRSIQQLPSKKKDAPAKVAHGVLFHDLEPTSQVMLLNLVYESMNRL